MPGLSGSPYTGGMTPVPTAYRGTMFRSRLEARWAVFFDAMAIPWAYEPHRVETAGGGYLPDFLVGQPQPPCAYCEHIDRPSRAADEWSTYFVEVKPYRPELDYIGMLMNVDGVILVGNIPKAHGGIWEWPLLRKRDADWVTFSPWHREYWMSRCDDGYISADSGHGVTQHDRLERIPKTIGRRSRQGDDYFQYDDDCHMTESDAYDYAKGYLFANQRSQAKIKIPADVIAEFRRQHP